jgi:hypothetical protein
MGSTHSYPRLNDSRYYHQDKYFVDLGKLVLQQIHHALTLAERMLP